jgi:hypothetical protein
MHQNATTPNQGQEKYVLQYGRGIETIPAESMGSNTATNFKHHQQAIAALVDKADKASRDDWNQVMGDLTAQYGKDLEHLDGYGKQVMRASLSLYLCWLHKLTEQRAPIPETLIDEAIDQADPDCCSRDWDIDRHICAIATLHPQYIEGLLLVLTNQLSKSAVGQGRGAA